MYLSRLSRSSEAKIRSRLRLCAQRLTNGRQTEQTLAWWTLRYPDLLRLRALLLATLSPATAHAALSAVRGVLRECWRLRLLTTDAYHRAIDFPMPERGHTLPAGRALTADELGALLAACQDGTTAGRRDLALLALLAGTGLRVSEACALRLEDYEVAQHRLRVRWGKGGRQRLAYIGDAGLRQALTDWLAVRGDRPGALIGRLVKGHDTPTGEALSADRAGEVMRERAAAAGIRHCSPHDLRRTFATGLWQAGADLASVGRLLGHAKLETTQLYLRDGDRLAEQAAALVRLPIGGRHGQDGQRVPADAPGRTDGGED